MSPNQAVRRLREVMRRQYKALSTEQTYVQWLRRYIVALRQTPAALRSEQKLERFLTDLARRQNVAASTQNQAFKALVYFYKEVLGTPLQAVNALRATRPAHLRHAPSVQETRALLQTVRDRAGYPTRLIARLLYGCGLRVSEPLNLRVKDLDLERGFLVIRGAKGGKDLAAFGTVRIHDSCTTGRRLAVAEGETKRKIAAEAGRKDKKERVNAFVMFGPVLSTTSLTDPSTLTRLDPFFAFFGFGGGFEDVRRFWAEEGELAQGFWLMRFSRPRTASMVAAKGGGSDRNIGRMAR